MLSCHTGKAADFSDLPLKNFHGVLLHSTCLRSYHGLSASPLLTSRGETLFPLSLGSTTFIIAQDILPCRAEAQEHIIKISVVDRWCGPAAANSHLLVSTPECSVLPFLPLVHSQTQSSLTIIYTTRTEESIASAGWVGASSWPSVAVDLICLPKLSWLVATMNWRDLTAQSHFTYFYLAKNYKLVLSMSEVTVGF